MAQVLDGLFGTPLREIWFLTKFRVPPAQFVGRARRTLLRDPEPASFWGHLLRQSVGQAVWTPLRTWAALQKRPPPARIVGRASSTPLREFGFFTKKRPGPARRCRMRAGDPPSAQLPSFAGFRGAPLGDFRVFEIRIN